METLVARLEAAVAKLESIESKLGLQSSSIPLISTRACEPPTLASQKSDDVYLNISEYDEFVEKSFGRVLGAAENIGGQVLEGTLVLKDALGVQRDFLNKIKTCKGIR